MEELEKNVDFIVLNKPSGLLMYESKNHSIVRHNLESVAEYVKKLYPEVCLVGDNPLERPGMVHRLDRETSGLIVIARNQAFFDYLKGEFQNNRVKKEYIALVYGKLAKPGVISKPIGLIAGSVRRSTRARRMKMVKPAVTRYEPVEVIGHAAFVTLLRVFPKTGRTHQIRVHLASIGHPVVGDKLYGSKKQSVELHRQFLHATTIEFTRPDGSVAHFEAPLPNDLEELLSRLRMSG